MLCSTEWSIWVSCPGCLSSVSSLGNRVGKEKVLTLCIHCSATAKTLVCDQHCFSCNSKNDKVEAAVNKIDSIPDRPCIIYKAVSISNEMKTDLLTHACNLFPVKTCICMKISLKVSLI